MFSFLAKICCFAAFILSRNIWKYSADNEINDPGSGSRHGNAAGLPELTGGRSRLDRDTGERACLADGVSQRGIRIVRKEDLAHSAVGKCPAELLDPTIRAA